MEILTELRKMAATCDSDYEMLKWLEAHKEELNKLGIWKPKHEAN